FYQILSVSPSASLSEIKSAYHRTLLLSHPDKHQSKSTSHIHIDVSLLREAYTTLSSSTLRSQYDIELARGLRPGGPRPAQIISLEEFTEGEGDERDVWSYPCRCGGLYVIREEEMEKGQHLVGCNCCSEVVWVGYEFAEEVVE
ncbi:hypothetical protein JAAARDRAFT_140717, partial [Jaapia argillacea MUCL 33604]